VVEGIIYSFGRYSKILNGMSKNSKYFVFPVNYKAMSVRAGWPKILLVTVAFFESRY
jgi:hypothetical protein